MSKIGKNLINYPKTNLITIDEYNKLSITTFFGYVSTIIPKELDVEIKKNSISLRPLNYTKKIRSLWGLYNRKLVNTIKGINNLHMVKLELRGVGFKGEIKFQDNTQVLILNIGFSHPVIIKIPSTILILPTLNKFKQLTNFVLLGLDKQELHELSQYIISLKKRDKYKGKGIYLEGEKITLKEGKKQGS